MSVTLTNPTLLYRSRKRNANKWRCKQTQLCNYLISTYQPSYLQGTHSSEL